MNPETILIDVEKAIKSSSCRGTGTYDIGFLKGSIVCFGHGEPRAGFVRVMSLTGYEMNVGIVSRRWAEIGARMYMAGKEIE